MTMSFFIRIIKKIVRILISNLFYFLDIIIPKDKNLIIFSSQNGRRYFDNSRYLFLNFIKNYDEEFEIKWISTDKNVLELVETETDFKYTLYLFSLEGIWNLLKAKHIFFTHGFGDILNLKFSQNKNIIQLWHGIPLKNIGVLDKKFTSKKKRNFYKETRKYNIIISSSDIDRYSMVSCFGVPIDRVKVTGLPRNDILFSCINEKVNSLNNKYDFLNKKIILYAPTFRDFSKVKFFPFYDFNLKELDLFLKEEDAYLLLRGHATDNIWRKNSVQYDIFNSERILEANQDKFEDVQELLPYVDILITDYSSIYIDFLILDRPLIFLPYDIEEYRKERGLLYDYNLVTPGPKPNTQKDFIKCIKDYFRDPKLDKEKRAWVKNIFHKYNDGKSYERIYHIIKELNK